MELIIPDITIQQRAAYKDYRLLRWLTSVDHKEIGLLYLWMALLFFVAGGILALLMRTQLAVAGNHFLSPDAYNQIFTMHGVTMIFFVMMPALLGSQVYMVPLMLGANDMAFPRMNTFSFWITLMGGVLLYFSFLAGGAPNADWFNYAPLNENNFSSSNGAGVGGVVVIVVDLLVAGSKAGWSPDFNTKMLPASVVRSGDSSVISGSVLFYQKGCLYCHQIGRYGGVKGSALTYVSRRLSVQEIQIRVINGGVNMPAYGQSLSGDELNRILAFLKTRQ